MSTSRQAAWPTVLLLVSMYGLLVGNFALYRTAPGPLWLHIAVSTLALHLAFTIWHEAAHRNLSRHALASDVVGILGILPYMAPYYLERWFHLQHHARLNLEDDPNTIYMDGPFWQMPIRYPRVLQYAWKRMVDDPRTAGQKIVDAAVPLCVLGIYALAWWKGALQDVVLLWFVPFVFAKVIMDWYVNYLPHVGLPPDRYRGTRIVDLPWLTPLLLNHNYHAIHHLWPNIPWYAYRATFLRERDHLESHGVPIETRLLGFWGSPVTRP